MKFGEGYNEGRRGERFREGMRGSMIIVQMYTILTD
jgi:ribosomal protein S6E (S10)